MLAQLGPQNGAAHSAPAVLQAQDTLQQSDADDYALLMGSMLLFGLLAAVMLLTRDVDWFRLGRSEEA